MGQAHRLPEWAVPAAASPSPMHNPAREALRPHRKHGEGQVSSHGGKQGRQVPQQTSPVLLPAPRLPWETALPKAAARAAAPALSEGKVGTTRGGPSCPTTPPPRAGLSSWGSNLGLPDLAWGWGWRGEGEGGRGAARSQVLALRKETEISRFCCCPTEPPGALRGQKPLVACQTPP